MNAKRTVAVALAALLVSTGAVAATPAGQAIGNAAETAADAEAEAGAPNERAGPNASENADVNATAATAGAASDSQNERGPPEDLPAQVPDHVSEIHDTIDSFLSGELERSLGEALSGLLGEGGESVDAETNANAGVTTSPSPTALTPSIVPV
jgi:hypothetical protein